jgi:hypothetical protein
MPVFRSAGGLNFYRNEAIRRAPNRSARRAGGNAALAQLVEHIIRNDGVACSSHASGTNNFN